MTRLVRVEEKQELAELLEIVPVRDGLAVERTVLAAERTLLAYVRTAFGLFAAGIAGAHFLTGPLEIIAVIVTASGVTLFPIAIRRYRKTQRVILEMLRRLAREEG